MVRPVNDDEPSELEKLIAKYLASTVEDDGEMNWEVFEEKSKNGWQDKGLRCSELRDDGCSVVIKKIEPDYDHRYEDFPKRFLLSLRSEDDEDFDTAFYGDRSSTQLLEELWDAAWKSL